MEEGRKTLLDTTVLLHTLFTGQGKLNTYQDEI